MQRELPARVRFRCLQRSRTDIAGFTRNFQRNHCRSDFDNWTLARFWLAFSSYRSGFVKTHKRCNYITYFSSVLKNCSKKCQRGVAEVSRSPFSLLPVWRFTSCTARGNTAPRISRPLHFSASAPFQLRVRPIPTPCPPHSSASAPARHCGGTGLLFRFVPTRWFRSNTTLVVRCTGKARSFSTLSDEFRSNPGIVQVLTRC